MPTYLRIRGYRVYFWTNESDEPIHFHICKGNPSHDDTKVWITKDRTMVVAHNKGHIPKTDMAHIMIVMADNIEDYIAFWNDTLEDLRFYEK